MNDRETPRLLGLVLLLTALLIGIGVIGLEWRSPAGGTPFTGSETEDRPTGEARHGAERRRPRPRAPSSPLERRDDAGGEPTPVDEAPVGVRLVGLLLDEEGEPVEGAEIAVHDLTGRLIGTATSGERGEYAVEALPAATDVAVRLRAPGFLSGWCCDVTTAPEETGRMATVHLRAGARLELDVTGVGALRDQLVVEREDGVTGRIASAEDDVARGWIGFLGPGTHRWRARLGDAVSPWYEVTVDARGRIRGPGAHPRRHELALVAPRTVRVELDVEAAEAAELVGTVALVRGDGDVVATRALADGSTVFDAVWPGTDYEVVVRTEDGRAGRRAVGAHGADLVRVRLEAAGTARVVVSNAEHDVVAGVRVTVAGRTVPSNDAGVAIVAGLAPGDYAVTVSDGRHRIPPDDRPRVKVASGYESQLDLTVVAAPRVPLRVRVTDALGRPAAELPLAIEELDLVAFTDQGGNATFPALALDVPVTVTSEHARIVGIRSAATLRPQLGAAPTSLIAVLPDDPTEGDETWPSLSGQVLDQDGKAVVGARVGGGRRWTPTDEEGRFELQVPPDLTRLVVGSPDRMWVPRTIAIDTGDVDEHGRAELPPIELERRPLARIEFAPDDSPTRFHARQVLLATDFRDEFLGGDRAALEASWIVTYDGTWVVLPPWSTDGRPTVMVAELGELGLSTAIVDWSPRSEPDVRLRPEVAAIGRLAGVKSRRGELTQISHAVDRAIETKTAGHPAAAVRGLDPFRSWLAAHPVRISLNAHRRPVELAAGVWRYDPNPAADGGETAFRVRPGERAVLPTR